MPAIADYDEIVLLHVSSVKCPVAQRYYGHPVARDGTAEAAPRFLAKGVERATFTRRLAE